jgi:hypothetical protein
MNISKYENKTRVKSNTRRRREERGGKNRWIVDARRKSRGEVRDALFSDRGKRASFL